MFADFKSALRQIAKSPWLSIVIILSLAVGIGANTVVFSWIQSVLFDPLPGVGHGRDLHVVQGRDRSGAFVATSWGNFKDIREQQTSFRDIAGSRIRTLSLGRGEAEDEIVWGEFVTDGFFSLLEVKPAFGRFFNSEETTRPGSSPVVVISESFWEKRFKRDPAVLGQTVKINNHALTIIGVAPRGFQGSWSGLGFEMWIPFTMQGELTGGTRDFTDRTYRLLNVLGALKDDVSREQANREMQTIYARLEHDFPAANQGFTVSVLPLWRSPFGAQAVLIPAFGTLQAMVFLVLLVVCANTATLLLARATSRQKEISIRLAVGAGSVRVVRQLLTESLVLALLGAAFGVLLAIWGIGALAAMPMPSGVPIHLVAKLNGQGLLFSCGLALLSGVVFGIAPALQLVRGNLSNALKAGGRSSGAAAHHRLRALLVGIEMTLAVVVLVLAGLFLKSFRNAQSIDPGFDRRGVLLASVDPATHGLSDAATARFISDVLNRLKAIPTVTDVSVANFIPLDLKGQPTAAVRIDGRKSETGGDEHVYFNFVTPGYFKTMGIAFISGGDFVDLENTTKPPEAVISQAMADHFWPGISPLGRKLTLDWVTAEVVGVVRDVRFLNLTDPPSPMVYISTRTRVWSSLRLHVRAKGDPAALAHDVTLAVHSVNPTLAVTDVQTLDGFVDGALVFQRMPARMLSTLGPLALLLAAIGIYSVIAYSVAQRTQEFGVRLTLGASPRTILLMVLAQGFRAIAGGLAVGILASYGVSRYLSPKMVGVPPGDLTVFGLVVLLLTAVSLFACWWPAKRATRVDPIEALRSE